MGVKIVMMLLKLPAFVSLLHVMNDEAKKERKGNPEEEKRNTKKIKLIPMKMNSSFFSRFNHELRRNCEKGEVGA